MPEGVFAELPLRWRLATHTHSARLLAHYGVARVL